MPEKIVSSELLPPEGDKDVGKQVFAILKDILDDKERLGLHKRWNRNYELKRGKHWKSKANSAVPLITANLMHTHRIRTINALTDNNPIFNIAKINDSEEVKQELYEDLQRTAEHWWIEQEQQDILDSTVQNGEDYGIAVEKIVFNPDIEEGGEVETVVVDPFHFGFFPTTITNPRDIQKAEAVLHFYPMSIREAKRKWPEFASRIKGEEEALKELKDDRRDINAVEGKKGSNLLTTLSSTVHNILNFNNGALSDNSEDVLIVECWSRDYTTVKEITKQVAVGPDGTEIVTEIESTRPKYPGNIRYTACCNAGKLTLDDRGNPNINTNLPEEQARKTYLFDKFPFSAANSVKDTASAWGCSDAEQLESLNTEFDKAISQLVLIKDKVVRPKLVNPKTSGVRNEELTNYPGIINPVNAQEGAGIHWLDFPKVPADIQNCVGLFKDLFFLVSGSFDVDMAQEPGRAVIAYKAIAALLERSNTMMRGKIRSYSRIIRERGRMYLSMVQNFYTEDRWITYRDNDGNEAYKKIRGTELLLPARLTVVTGSTMPVSKVQIREEAIQLFEAGAIDQEELLKRLEWSGRTEVVKRMKQGVLGQLMEKMDALGMPPELGKYFEQVVGMKDNDFKRAIRDGQIPKFQEVIQAVGGGEEPPDQKEMADVAVKQAEVAEKMAVVRKTDAEAALLGEKANTERVRQQVQLAGVGYDDEELKIRRFEAITKLKTEKEKTAAEERAYQERGMKSNNAE